MLYCSVPYRSGAKTFDCQIFFKGHNNYGYFNKDNERRLLNYFIRRHLKDKNYLTSKINRWRVLVKHQQSFLSQLNAIYLKKLSNADFFNVYRKFCLFQLAYWQPTLMIEYSDPWSDKIISDYLTKYRLKLSAQNLSILTAPKLLTFAQQEELDLLSIVKNYLAHRNINRQLANHAKKYSWQSITWLKAKMLSQVYFLKRLKEMAKLSHQQINERIRNLSGYSLKINRSKSTIVSKNHLNSSQVALFDFFACLCDWREERKKYGMLNNKLTENFAEELAKRSGVDKHLLYFLDGFEITSLPKIVKMTVELKKRQRAVFYNYTSMGIWRLVGQEAEKMNKIFENRINLKNEELQGFIACRGMAFGRVKVIMSHSEFKKFKPGDVLVTQMTRPEFVPLMKKAAAIITDEGGITSHAAVISRELNKPCIIGTQVATSLLKDGDRVEVDANKGIVKLLEKAFQ